MAVQLTGKRGGSAWPSLAPGTNPSGRGRSGLNPLHRIPREGRWLRLASQPSSAPPHPPKPTLDDEGLIDAVIHRDVRRASELHDRLISVIESTLYRLLGKREPDHDDLVQATFEQVVITLVRGSFSKGCTLTTWASTVAAHVAYNALRARRRARRVFHPADVADVADRRTLGDPERDMCVREQIQTVQAHLTAMSPEKAMVLLLHDVLGHELAEIAAMLDISVGAAQSRLFRGRRDLLRRLGAGNGSQQEGPGRVW
jgi:RNA polymerase sigma-70 factor, ECF subfamily